MAGLCESGWLNSQRSDGRRARDTLIMMMVMMESGGSYALCNMENVINKLTYK